MSCHRSLPRSIFALFFTLLLIPGARSASSPDGRWTMDLSGPQWQMEGIRPGQGIKEGFQEHFGEVCPINFNWNNARVPGDVYTDLWRAGELADPHYGRNGIRAKWVMEKEWWYRCKFTVPEEQKGRVFRLLFDGVDYACDVWLNGRHLGRHEGMFSPFEFDATPHLRFGAHVGGNGLVIRLDPPPRNYRLIAGRKFPWHGDYWRTIAPIGIWKPVHLVAHGPQHLEDVHPKSTIHPDGSATVDVTCTVTGEAPGTRLRAIIRGASHDAGPYEADTVLAPRTSSATVSLKIPDAKLWWPWEMGKPNLYTVEASILDGTGRILDHTTTRFGIREIKMERNPGYTEDEVQHAWTMVINGKRLFLRSANWGGPPDIFYGRNSSAKYRTLVEMARDSNLNNLRIFGWHPPEVDEFYDLCDELGITVWQDLLPLASVILPTHDAFRDATHAEAEAVIKTLRRHPSLVLLEGGEESFYGFQGLESNARFLLELEGAIRPHTDLPYIPTSPLDWPRMLHKLGLGKPKDSAHTHKMFYTIGEVLMEDEVPTWDVAAIPEFAVSSPPNVDSIRKFIPPEEVWPPGPSWGYHWADLDIFRNLNFQVFGDECTGSLEQFVDGTQIAQGTIFQFGIEHMRRRKPKSSAISICHFITYAPDMKWGIVDYFQQPKLSYNFVKRACQPLLVSLQFDKRRWQPGETFRGKIWIVNDLHEEFNGCAVDMRIKDSEGLLLLEKLVSFDDTIAPDRAIEHAPVEWLVPKGIGSAFRVSLRLINADGKELSSNHYDLLKGNQDKARKECARRALQWQELKKQYQPADYQRFFPGLTDPDRLGDIPPKADGF